MSEVRRPSWLLAVGPFIGLALVIALFAAMSGAPDRYLSANNLRVVLAQTVIVALGAIGMTLIIVGGGSICRSARPSPSPASSPPWASAAEERPRWRASGPCSRAGSSAS